MRGRMFLAVVLAGLTAEALAAQTEKAPEFSCAAFPAPVTETWLIERFGTANVVADSIVGGDDGPFPGTVVYPSPSEDRVDVAWQDERTRTAARLIRIRREGRWSTSYGFGVGSDLRSVERANGWPFRLSGFVREGGSGGQVLSWGNGRFRFPDPAGRCREFIQIQPSYDGSGDPLLYRQVGRIREVSSGHPAMQEINPRVVSIWLFYDGP
jgi:hypothetical protein